MATLTESQMWICEELAEKIDYEGGLPAFLLGYSTPEAFKGLPFYGEAIHFVAAYKDLVQTMEWFGFPFK